MTRTSQARRAPLVVVAREPRSRRDNEERERLAEIVAHPTFKRFCAIVTPAVASTYVLWAERGAGMFLGRPAAQKAIPHAAALAAHLLAGDFGCAVALEGCKRDRVRGVGFSYRDDAETSRVAIHLAARFCGYEPAEIVGRLAARVGYDRLLVTSSGDPRGGYVCHLRVPPMGVGAARGRVATLLEAIGFAPRSGVIEVHPTSRPGLLPFGLGGREFFHAVGVCDEARFFEGSRRRASGGVSRHSLGS